MKESGSFFFSSIAKASFSSPSFLFFLRFVIIRPLLLFSYLSPPPRFLLSLSFSKKTTTTISYDIGVTGGVTSMPAFLSSFFPAVAAQQLAASSSDARSPYCKFDSPVLQLFTSSLFLAGLVSSLLASGVTRQ
jgi:hypothetical protein